MRTVIIGYNNDNATYYADIRDEQGNIESATVNQSTKNKLNEWLNWHDVTRDEYLNAKIEGIN